MSMTLIGLKNCDSCKKARAWLDARGIDYGTIDVRADGIAERDLQSWIAAHGDWQPFVNRRGTTWRQLDDQAKDNLTMSRAVALILASPTLMKRPVIVMDNGNKTIVTVGFGAAEQDLIAKSSA